MPEWEAWEDWQAGIYQTSEGLEQRAQALLSDPEQFRETAREMVRAWPNAAMQNLRNMRTGRRAWLGQASCCYSLGAPSVDTRTAWGAMTNPQQRAANAVADEVIAEWRKEQADAEALSRR